MTGYSSFLWLIIRGDGKCKSETSWISDGHMFEDQTHSVVTEICKSGLFQLTKYQLLPIWDSCGMFSDPWGDN